MTDKTTKKRYLRQNEGEQKEEIFEAE